MCAPSVSPIRRIKRCALKWTQVLPSNECVAWWSSATFRSYDPCSRGQLFMIDGGDAALLPTSQTGSQLLVLIAGEVVDSGLLRGAPALLRGSRRAEAVRTEPAVATLFLLRCPVECVEADPQPVVVSMTHQRAEAPLVSAGPGCRVLLPALLHHAPRVIPPTAVVVRRSAFENVRRIRCTGGVRSPNVRTLAGLEILTAGVALAASHTG
jgi:hypothetical protein